MLLSAVALWQPGDTREPWVTVFPSAQNEMQRPPGKDSSHGPRRVAPVAGVSLPPLAGLPSLESPRPLWAVLLSDDAEIARTSTQLGPSVERVSTLSVLLHVIAV